MPADSYTSILGTLVMGTGNDNNNWGDNANASVFAILEAAIAKRTTHTSLTGGTLDLSTTIPPAGASSAIEMIHYFSGTLSSSQIVQPPNISKLWLVHNALVLGSYTLTFKTSGGTASGAIPVGWGFVWCDGAGVCYAGLSSALRDTQFTAADGTVAAPGYAFTNALTTGLRHSGYAAGTESNNPFTTTNTSATVSVAHTTHGLTTSDYVYFSGAAAVGGITPDGLYAVAGITSANAYTFTHSAAATSSTSGGGASVAYKYLYSTANTGTAQSVVAAGADVAHVSPWGALFTGKLAATSDLIIGGLGKIVGALTIGGTFTGVAATLTGTLTGVAATLSGLLTLSSTSHMLMASGTTGQRPSSQTAARVRYNSTTNFLEYDNGTTWIACEPLSLRGYIDGCTISNSGGLTVNLDFAAGVCRDSTNATTITCAAMTGKVVGSAWSAGSSGGLLDTGAIANATYHVYAILKTDGTQDYVISTSASSPTLPSGYTYYRMIGSIVRLAGAVRLFTQYHDYFSWSVPILDVSNATPGTGSNTVTLSVPTGIVVGARMNLIHAASDQVYVRSLTATDAAPSATLAPLGHMSDGSGGGGNFIGEVWTDTSAQIAYRSGSNNPVYIATLGFTHPLGRNA